MNRFINTIKREISKIKSNKFLMVMLFIAPIVFSIIVIWTFSAGIPRNLPIAVLDLDNSDITRTITRAIDSTPSAKVRYKVENYNQGYDLIKEGKVYAIIVYPQNFKKDLNRNNTPKIVYYYNNQMILIGSIITKDIQSTVMTLTKSVDAQIRMKKGLAKDPTLSKINLIRVDEKIKSNPYLNYSYFLSYAAVAHVFQIFAVLLAVWTLGIEFKEGTTKEWLKEADNSIISAAFGKLSVYLIVLLIQMFIVYGGYVIIYGAPFEGNILFTIFSSGIFLLAYQLMGLAFVAVLSNLRFAMSVGAFYTSLGFSLAGMTFPNMGMPLFTRFYSSLLPVRPYVNLLIDQAMKGFMLKYDLIYLFWIMVIGLLGTMFVPLLKKHANNEDLWYQI